MMMKGSAHQDVRDQSPGRAARGRALASRMSMMGAARTSQLLDQVIQVLLVGSVILFIAYPIASIFLCSVGLGSAVGATVEGDWWSQYAIVWSNYRTNLGNSVFTGVCVSILTTILSVAMALFAATRRGAARVICMAILLVVMVSPPFVSSLAYIQLYGKRGWITYRLLGITWDPYNCWGVIAMQALSFVPMNAILLMGIIAKIDSSAIRAARDMGAGPSRILRDIVLPLMRPGILVVLVLTFMRSCADFATPVIIGGRFSTLASEIYLQIVGYANLPKASAMNMYLLLPSIAAFFLYRHLMAKSDLLTGVRSTEGNLGLRMGKCGPLGWLVAAAAVLFIVLMVLQYTCIIGGAFTKMSRGSLVFTTQHWGQLWKYDSMTMVRSVVYALVVSVAGTVFAAVFAYYMNRRRVPGRKVWDCIATLPYMLPGSCFGIGYILAFNGAPWYLTGTAAIVMLNMFFKQLPTTTKLCAAALATVPPQLEDAVRDMGGSRLRVLTDAVLPAMRPALLNSFAYNFSSCMTTSGAILFLISPSHKLAVFKLFDAVSTGDYGVAACIATLIMVIVLVVEGAVFWLGRDHKASDKTTAGTASTVPIGITGSKE